MDEQKEQAADRTASKESQRLFKADDIPEIKRLFEEADEDGSGALDMDEFYLVMKKMYANIDREAVTILHMQVDANCDGTVDLGELLTFLVNKSKAAEATHYTDESFPRPIKLIPGNDRETIIGLEFRPIKNDSETHTDSLPENQRRYINGKYITMSSCGILSMWSDSFEMLESVPLFAPRKPPPYSHPKRIDVRQMVYMTELRQLAIRTFDREIQFFDFVDCAVINPVVGLIVDTNRPIDMSYWSDGTKAVFSLGDAQGFSYVCVSTSVKENGLFPFDAYENISLQPYPTVNVSSLLKSTVTTHQCLQIYAFNDLVSNVQYFPSLNALAICGRSSKKMVLAVLPESPRTKVSKYVFKSTEDAEFFTCVDCAPTVGVLVTGGTDGVLRVWDPTITKTCEAELQGHVTPITHVMFNHIDRVIVSVSEDKNIRVWSDKGWQCKQSFDVDEIGHPPISAIFYNIWNNDLILANSNIGKMFGKGTDLFIQTMTSHDKPLCRALYHPLFKQVVSVSQNGMVKVWDIFTGRIIIKFKVSPGKSVGHIAMSFDAAQRRLITVSTDRKVRLWNFNNGTEIHVLPVKMPKEVTSIVCWKDRVFVASRNCKTIFDLDIEGLNNKYLSHQYLIDISSMDVYENVLVAASSNGNIVTWDIEKGQSRFWLNGSISPKTFLLDAGVNGEARSMPVEDSEKKRVTRKGRSASLTENETAVNNSPLVLGLKKRKMDSKTASLLVSTDGYISAWNVGLFGRLFGKFRAVDIDGAVITAMSTDVNEAILLTGDSTGKVCLWDIRNFGYRDSETSGPFEDFQGWPVSLCPPPLLSKWQSNLSAVVSVVYDPASNNVIAASLDCNMGLWTNTGYCIGIFRKDEWDANARNSPFQESKMLLPIQTPRKIGKRFLAASHTVRNIIHTLNLMKPEAKEDSKQTLDHVKLPPIPNTGQLVHRQSELKPHGPQTSNTRGGTGLEQSSPQTASPKLNQTRNKYGRVLRHHTSDILTPDPPNTLPGKQTFEQRSGHVKLPPIPNTGHVMHNQGELKQHLPQTSNFRDGTRLEQSSPQTASPNLNQTRYKYGRAVRLHPIDILTPHPPDTLPGQQAFRQTSDHVKLPPISNTGQLMSNQSELKPHVPRMSNVRGDTGLERSSPQRASPDLNQTRCKYGRVLRHNPNDILTPHPPNTLPGKQEFAQTSNQVKLPPIPNTGQLMRSQSVLKPHVPQTSNIKVGTGLEQSSPQTASPNLNQTRYKYGRVLRHDPTGILTPDPPNTLQANRLLSKRQTM